jgi:hypothetical protein
MALAVWTTEVRFVELMARRNNHVPLFLSCFSYVHHSFLIYIAEMIRWSYRKGLFGVHR